MATSESVISEESKKVKDVAKDFLLKGDEQFAKILQDKEYLEHGDFNKQKTQNIRVNIPVAKTIQNKEYQKLLERHQMLEQMEKEDALVALQIQEQLLREENGQINSQEKIDLELARRLQETEIFNDTNLINNSSILKKTKIEKFNNDSISNEDSNSLNDEALARALQEEEKQFYELERQRFAKEKLNQQKYKNNSNTRNQNIYSFGSDSAAFKPEDEKYEAKFAIKESPFLVDNNQYKNNNNNKTRINEPDYSCFSDEEKTRLGSSPASKLRSHIQSSASLNSVKKKLNAVVTTAVSSIKKENNNSRNANLFSK